MKAFIILGMALALTGCGKTLSQIQKAAHELVDIAGKAYEDGKASYNVDAARSPCSLGWIEFEITPRIIKQDGSVRVEMNIRGTS